MLRSHHVWLRTWWVTFGHSPASHGLHIPSHREFPEFPLVRLFGSSPVWPADAAPSVPQQSFLDLAHGVTWQVINETDLPGAFVRSQGRGGKSEQRLLVHWLGGHRAWL